MEEKLKVGNIIYALKTNRKFLHVQKEANINKEDYLKNLNKIYSIVEMKVENVSSQFIYVSEIDTGYERKFFNKGDFQEKDLYKNFDAPTYRIVNSSEYLEILFVELLHKNFGRECNESWMVSKRAS